jgi:hypothetical protein
VLQEDVVAQCVNGCKVNHVDGALIHNSSDPSVFGRKFGTWNAKCTRTTISMWQSDS